MRPAKTLYHLFVKRFDRTRINANSDISDHSLRNILPVCSDDGNNWVISSISILGENGVVCIGCAVDLRMRGVRLQGHNFLRQFLFKINLAGADSIAGDDSTVSSDSPISMSLNMDMDGTSGIES